MLTLVIIIIIIALIFDFFNGFNDAANSIATIVSTRVLTPRVAVMWAAFFNLAAAFLFDVHIAKTIGKGLIELSAVNEWVIMAGLIGATTWNATASFCGIPSSATHALIGGYAGAAVVRAGWECILIPGWIKTLAFIIVAPIMGMIIGFVMMIAIMWIFQNNSATNLNNIFRKLQLVSAAAYSLGHGTNDAQKTMGIITVLLVTAGYLKTFEVPYWVILASHFTIAMGTMFGGWRVVRTMGQKITKLKPSMGFSAESAGAFTLLITAFSGIAVSTTHVISGAIMGVGATKRASAVRWGVAGNIVIAWILTIPASALVGALVLGFIELIHWLIGGGWI
ncbi:MAG: inorganic phosphate transporter [Calditrichaeota bacterium]|nr:inorganic phosphate transporter [Calditrichota bacterium]